MSRWNPQTNAKAPIKLPDSTGVSNATLKSDEDTVTVRNTKTKQYTEHTARVEFMDGETREVTFDAMREKDDGVVLKNYTAYEPNKSVFSVSFKPGGGDSGAFVSESFMMIPYSNLKVLETVAREEKEMEYEVEKEVPVSEVE